MSKTCNRCYSDNPVSGFGPNAARKDGLQVYCRDCMTATRKAAGYDKARWATKRSEESARNRTYRAANAERLSVSDREKARRRRVETPWKVNANNQARKASLVQATPAWADKAAILVLYEKASVLSDRLGVEFQVDHVVPLRGKTVCGLHVPANLQLLEKTENHKKRHYSWPDMP